MEGVISVILVFAKDNHGLTEDSLNTAISKFNGNADALEKYNCLPLPNARYIAKSKSFACDGTAAQTRTLLTRLPYILNLVNLTHPELFFRSKHFKYFSLLVKISSFVHATCLHYCDVRDLKLLISKFLTLHVEILSSSNNNVKRYVKPKAHHLIHYPDLTFQNGPLRYSSTLCHERSMAKYKLTIHSHLNPTFQIANAMRFQMLTYANSCFEFFSYIDNKTTDLSKYTFPNVQLPQSAIVHKKLKFHGMMLASGLAVLSDMPSATWLTQSNPPSFCQIKLVYSVLDNIFLVLQDMKVVTFLRNFMAYEVQYTTKFYVMEIKNLPILKTFSIHEFNEKMLLFPDSLPFKEY